MIKTRTKTIKKTVEYLVCDICRREIMETEKSSEIYKDDKVNHRISYRGTIEDFEEPLYTIHNSCAKDLIKKSKLITPKS